MSDRCSPRRLRGFVVGAAAALTLSVPPATQAAPVLYGITFSNQLITINTATGAGTVVGPLDSSMGAFGLGTVGTNLYTFDQTADLLRQLDPATGDTLSSVDPGLGNLIGEGAIDFRSDGTGFLTTASPGPNLYSFTTAGGGTLIGGTSQVIDGLAFNSADVLYGLVQGGTSLVTINQSTGSLTVVGLTGISGAVLGGLSFLGDQLYAVTATGALGPSSLYTLDPSTGLATLVGSVGINGVSGIAFLDTMQQAPEPSSLLLVGLGLAVAARRRLRTTRS